jgi:DNA-binding transcriptional LysR family regulator
MLLDRIKLQQLRIFQTVYRTRNMTLAAREQHLTQSGISQHISALEELLGGTLFDRIGRKLLPTSLAAQLYQELEEKLEPLGQVLEQLRERDSIQRILRGTVSIGMPVEFGQNKVIPGLSSVLRQEKEIKVHFRLGFATHMQEMLLAGEVDFAFIDEAKLDQRIEREVVYEETWELCLLESLAHSLRLPRSLFRPGPTGTPTEREVWERIPLVDYQRDEAVVRRWLHHHLGFRHLRLNLRSTVVDAKMVAGLILSGEMAGVLPGHLVESLQKVHPELRTVRVARDPLKNPISLATLQGKTQTPSALRVLETLRLHFKGERKNSRGKT